MNQLVKYINLRRAYYEEDVIPDLVDALHDAGVIEHASEDIEVEWTPYSDDCCSVCKQLLTTHVDIEE